MKEKEIIEQQDKLIQAQGMFISYFKRYAGEAERITRFSEQISIISDELSALKAEQGEQTIDSDVKVYNERQDLEAKFRTPVEQGDGIERFNKLKWVDVLHREDGINKLINPVEHSRLTAEEIVCDILATYAINLSIDPSFLSLTPKDKAKRIIKERKFESLNLHAQFEGDKLREDELIKGCFGQAWECSRCHKIHAFYVSHCDCPPLTTTSVTYQ